MKCRIIFSYQTFFVSASIGLSDEEKEFQNLAFDFASKELEPNMQMWDEKVNCIARSVCMIE